MGETRVTIEINWASHTFLLCQPRLSSVYGLALFSPFNAFAHSDKNKTVDLQSVQGFPLVMRITRHAGVSPGQFTNSILGCTLLTKKGNHIIYHVKGYNSFPIQNIVMVKTAFYNVYMCSCKTIVFKEIWLNLCCREP